MRGGGRCSSGRCSRARRSCVALAALCGRACLLAAHERRRRHGRYGMQGGVGVHDEVVRVRGEGEYADALERPCRADRDATRMLRQEGGVQRGAELAGVVRQRRHDVLAAALVAVDGSDHHQEHAGAHRRRGWLARADAPVGIQRPARGEQPQLVQRLAVATVAHARLDLGVRGAPRKRWVTAGLGQKLRGDHGEG